MSTPAPDAPDAVLEVWTYGGMRLSTKDTRLGAWVEPSGKTLHFKHKSGFIVGCEYEVRVRRDDDGGTSMIGAPRFLGRSEDTDLARRLAAEERAYEQDLAVIQRERKAKEANPFDEAIDEVARHIRHLPAPQRAGVIAYVNYRLSRSWR